MTYLHYLTVVLNLTDFPQLPPFLVYFRSRSLVEILGDAFVLPNERDEMVVVCWFPEAAIPRRITRKSQINKIEESQLNLGLQ